MNPTLPGALIEREKKCDRCLAYVTEWEEKEISTSGTTMVLCLDCQKDIRLQLEYALGFRKSGQSAEDAAQEE